MVVGNLTRLATNNSNFRGNREKVIYLCSFLSFSSHKTIDPRFAEDNLDKKQQQLATLRGESDLNQIKLRKA